MFVSNLLVMVSLRGLLQLRLLQISISTPFLPFIHALSHASRTKLEIRSVGLALFRVLARLVLCGRRNSIRTRLLQKRMHPDRCRVLRIVEERDDILDTSLHA